MHKNYFFLKFVNLTYQEMNGWKRRCYLRKELQINEDDVTCFSQSSGIFPQKPQGSPFSLKLLF